MKFTATTMFSAPGTCPICHDKGQSITLQTMSNHVNDVSTLSKEKEYWVCKNPACECAYFGGSLVKIADLNKEFGLKTSSSPDANLCYCFHITKSEVCDESIELIEDKMNRYGCQCVNRNITGKCCLNDIKKYLAKESE